MKFLRRFMMRRIFLTLAMAAAIYTMGIIRTEVSDGGPKTTLGTPETLFFGGDSEFYISDNSEPLFFGGGPHHYVSNASMPVEPAVDAGSVVAPAELVALITVSSDDVFHDGYDRDSFQYPSRDVNGCSTRDLVLARETRDASMTVIDGCWVKSGSWLSVYDDSRTTDPKALEVDHVVAIHEAYQSGAHMWGLERRAAFANDLSAGTLRAVSVASNQEKSDLDAAQWRPRRQFWCQYAVDVATVKVRWGLTADPAEVQALLEMAAACPSSFKPAVPALA